MFLVVEAIAVIAMVTLEWAEPGVERSIVVFW